MIKDLVRRNRSYRRFYQDFLIDSKTLLDLVDLVRLTASGANKQSLRFKLINKSPETEKVFSCLAWAGYLENWHGPEDGEQPSAYIVILNDPKINENPQYDVGLACQSLLLGAVEQDLGGCIFASVRRDQLKKLLNLPQDLDIMLVIALGKPKEEIVIVDVENDDIKYWRDMNGRHHVPKRKLEDIIL